MVPTKDPAAAKVAVALRNSAAQAAAATATKYAAQPAAATTASTAATDPAPRNAAPTRRPAAEACAVRPNAYAVATSAVKPIRIVRVRACARRGQRRRVRRLLLLVSGL